MSDSGHKCEQQQNPKEEEFHGGESHGEESHGGEFHGGPLARS